VASGIDPHILNGAAIQFRKERAEPFWMLVVNR